MFASNLLLWSYKSTLLSTLITIYYENPINTLEDVDRSGLPVMVPNNTVLHWLIATDPRPTTKSIFKKSVLYPFNGTNPAWTTKRYALKKSYAYLYTGLTDCVFKDNRGVCNQDV